MIVLEGSIELALFFSVALSYIQGYGTVIRCEGQKLDWGDRFYVVLNPTDRRKPHLLPQLPSSLRDTLESYFSEQKKVGMALLELIGKTIGMDKKEVEEMFYDGLQSMRMSYYPPYPHPEQVVGIRPHSDATGITILHQANGVEGFQIKKNGVWMPITFLPHAFVVNVGDIMEILSNGMYTSIEHRALVNSEKERFSIAMFFNPKFEAEVGPLKSLISSQNPPVVCEESSLQECFAIDGDGSSSKSGKNEEAVIPEGFENVEASEMQCILRNEDVPAITQLHIYTFSSFTKYIMLDKGSVSLSIRSSYI